MLDASAWLPGPRRRPDWRLLRAAHLHRSGKQPVRSLDDVWVQRIVRVLRDPMKPGRDGGVRRAILLSRELDSDRFSRARVEALLLTRTHFSYVADEVDRI